VVESSFLEKSKNYLQPQHYEAVYLERSLMGKCGWPGCNKSKPIKPRSRYRITKGELFDDEGIEHYCSLECYKASKFYHLQLSDESVYHRTRSLQNTKITERRIDNGHAEKKNNLEEKKFLKKINNEESENSNDSEEDNNIHSQVNTVSEDFNVDLSQYFATLSDFGKVWDLFLTWVSEDTINFFLTPSTTMHTAEAVKGDDVGPEKPSVDGVTANITRRKVFGSFTYPCFTEYSNRLQFPNSVHNEFFLCMATFNFKNAIPDLSTNLWRQIVLTIIVAISDRLESEVTDNLQTMLPTLMQEISLDQYSLSLLKTLLKTGE
jgi:hypothetical protein